MPLPLWERGEPGEGSVSADAEPSPGFELARSFSPPSPQGERVSFPTPLSPERLPHQRRIARGLQAAAASVVNQERDPQARIAERAQREPRRHEQRQRG